MRLQHRCLLMSAFTIFFRLSRYLEAPSAPIIDKIVRRHTGSRPRVQTRCRASRCTTTTTIRLAAPVSPGCYLPSDGCLSEYSVQN